MKRKWNQGAGAIRALAVVGVVGSACLTRPVETWNPNLKTSFTSALTNVAVDKIDLLFMIDNSVSMADKQSLLAQAVPDMITRLVTPNCVDAMGNNLGPSTMDGTCAQGKVEFPPVHDMHIGIVSSSLGGRGATITCPTSGQLSMNPANPALPAHNDDAAHLLNRGGADEHQVVKAGQNNFLAWFPPVGANSGTTPPANAETTAGAPGMTGTLIGDFTDMITGVHEHGCGFEAQNEAWYRFLVQPDPFQQISKDGSGTATLSGLDTTILAQRAAFLRPDSLLAVIVLTDENEEVANPLALGGKGWAYEETGWPFTVMDSTGASLGAPEGTTTCQTAPNDPSCLSCAFQSVVSNPNYANICPPDEPNGPPGYLTQSDDGTNVRFFHQKQRFGVFVGYPISRYIRGLTQPTVPDRNHEVDGAGNYIGDSNANCINPIFANDLSGTTKVTDPNDPALCNLTPGPRTSNLVFYAAIAGVPHQLLQAQPGDMDCPAGTAPQDCPQKSTFTSTDWKTMVGNDPDNYDFSGADFHMLESIDPRSQSSCPPGSSDTCDAINGREWTTNKVDLQFSCIFPLVDPATGASTPKDCTQSQFTGACDCFQGGMLNGMTTPASNASQSQLCQKDATGAYTNNQIFGKAYPSVREIEIAHAMSNVGQSGGQGIVSSLCPIHTSYANGNTSDPLYGYRPAVKAIVDRLKNALNVQCLPEQLNVDQNGNVPCLVLVALAPDTRLEQACNSIQGLSIPPSDILQRFQDTAVANYNALGGMKSGLIDPRTQPVCEINQILSSDQTNYAACVNGGQGAPGWCYVTGAAAGTCPQQILFTQNMPPHGGQVSLQCIEQTNAIVDGGTAP